MEVHTKMQMLQLSIAASANEMAQRSSQISLPQNELNIIYKYLIYLKHYFIDVQLHYYKINTLITETS